MGLNTIQKVGITVGAVVTALTVAYTTASIVEDTPFGANAAVVDVRFRKFAHSHGQDLGSDENFKAVLSFFKNPYGAKLFAVKGEDDQYTYHYVAKGEKNENGKYISGWKQYKNTDKTGRGMLNAYDEVTFESLLADPDVLKDWDAVNKFMDDYKDKAAPHKVAVEVASEDEEDVNRARVKKVEDPTNSDSTRQ